MRAAPTRIAMGQACEITERRDRRGHDTIVFLLLNHVSAIRAFFFSRLEIEAYIPHGSR